VPVRHKRTIRFDRRRNVLGLFRIWRKRLRTFDDKEQMTPKKDSRSSPQTHVVLRLRTGWTYDPDRRRFSKAGGELFLPSKDLPKNTRIKYQVPSMAKKSKRSQAEDELARGIQIVPPRDESLARLLKRIQSWPCVENAWISPELHPAANVKMGAKPARPNAG
jgi:hypothetical protein